jgi:hypothetical protein
MDFLTLRPPSQKRMCDERSACERSPRVRRTFILAIMIVEPAGLKEGSFPFGDPGELRVCIKSFLHSTTVQFLSK